MEEFRKSKLFKLGKISKKHFILYILSPFTYYFNNKLLDYFKQKNIWYNESLNYFSIYFGYTLIGLILFIYTKIINSNEKSLVQQKTKNKISINSMFTIDMIKKTPSYYKKKIIIMFLILIIITDCISTFIFTYFQKFSNFFKYLGYLYPLEIISFILLSNLILKLEIFKHHLLSLIIIIIGLLIINIINFTSISYNLNELFVISSLFILQYLYPLLDIIVYYILYEKEFNFSLFIFLIGIMGIIVGIIISFLKQYLLFNFLNINIFKDIDNFKNISHFILFILISISNGITYCLLYSIFKLFKPCCYAITAVINGLLNIFNDIFNIIFGQNQFNILLLFQIIIYIILFFACLVFNEQIICNFWELNKYTKEEIINRAYIDSNNIELNLQTIENDINVEDTQYD